MSEVKIDPKNLCGRDVVDPRLHMNQNAHTTLRQ